VAIAVASIIALAVKTAFFILWTTVISMTAAVGGIMTAAVSLAVSDTGCTAGSMMAAAVTYAVPVATRAAACTVTATVTSTVSVTARAAVD
jgi:hypothetical protein